MPLAIGLVIFFAVLGTFAPKVWIALRTLIASALGVAAGIIPWSFAINFSNFFWSLTMFGVFTIAGIVIVNVWFVAMGND